MYYIKRDFLMSLSAVMPIYIAQAGIAKAQEAQKQAIQEIASGLLANVNPADEYISQKLETEIRAANEAMSNAQTGINVTAVADATLNNVSQSLGRIQELATQAANGVYSDSQRNAIQMEINHNVEQIRQTLENATFNGKKVLNIVSTGESPSADISFQVGTGSDSNSTVSYDPNLTLGEMNFDVTTTEGARNTLNSINNLLGDINSKRGEIGATSAKLQSSIEQQMTNMMNSTASKSSMSDADYLSAFLKFKQAGITQESLIQVIKSSMQSQKLLLNLI